MAKRITIHPMRQAWINERLKQIGSNQSRLAEELKIPATRVSMMCREERQIRLDEALIVARHLKMNFVEFVAIITETPQSEFGITESPDIVDEELLQTVIEEFEEALTDRKLSLPAKKKARAMIMLYKYYMTEEDAAAGSEFAHQLIKVV